MICFFIGHRNAPSLIYNRLADAIEQHITELGVSEFVVGCYGAFDSMVVTALREAKKRHPEIILTMLVAYRYTTRSFILPNDFNSTLYPNGIENVPHKAAIIYANKYMADRADYLIAYSWETASNATDLVKYAHKRGKHITNISLMP